MRRSPWLNRNHPDPHGEQLRKIAFVLKVFAAKAREYAGCRVGVFWDYCSLPQKTRGGVDDRTPEEIARFRRALNGINAWCMSSATEPRTLLDVACVLPSHACGLSL